MAKRSRENEAEFVRSHLSAQRAELLENEEGARVGRDPEHLHRMRVATRRARVALRAAKGAFEPGQSAGLRAELAWLGGVLGAVRDLDVLTDHLRKESEMLEPAERSALKPVFSAIAAERRKARGALTRALNGKRYRLMLDELGRIAEAPASDNARLHLDRRVRKEFAGLAKSMRALNGEPTDDEIHRVRILGKRSRYVAEFAAQAPSKAAAEFIKRAKSFQDVTGKHHDAVVAEAKLRSLVAADDGMASLAVGRLIERERERTKSARAQLPDAWRKLERAGARAWS